MRCFLSLGEVLLSFSDVLLSVCDVLLTLCGVFLSSCFVLLSFCKNCNNTVSEGLYYSCVSYHLNLHVRNINNVRLDINYQ